jgi:antitoxin VapB
VYTSDFRLTVMQTKAFKSGNSLAVRIPKDLAIFEPSQDVIIERKGDTLVLRAAERKSLEHVMDIFAGFSPGFMVDGRLPQDQDERDWGGWLPAPEPVTYSVQQPKAVYNATKEVAVAPELAAKKKTGAKSKG